MGAIAAMLGAWEFNRMLTRATLDAIAESGDASAVLGWRPAPGRAHIAWQLMHIAWQLMHIAWQLMHIAVTE